MALSADKIRYKRGTPLRGSCTTADSQVFYVGALVMHNGTAAVVGADTASCKILGVSVDALTTGTSNTAKVVYEYGHEEWFPRAAAITVADIGANAVISDDNLVTDAGGGTNDCVVGRIVELETIGGQIGAWVAVALPAT